MICIDLLYINYHIYIYSQTKSVRKYIFSQPKCCEKKCICLFHNCFTPPTVVKKGVTGCEKKCGRVAI